jgi:hypothetical protein
VFGGGEQQVGVGGAAWSAEPCLHWEDVVLYKVDVTAGAARAALIYPSSENTRIKYTLNVAVG